jgi:hypothetical protein
MAVLEVILKRVILLSYFLKDSLKDSAHEISQRLGA